MLRFPGRHEGDAPYLERLQVRGRELARLEAERRNGVLVAGGCNLQPPPQADGLKLMQALDTELTELGEFFPDLDDSS